MNFKRNAALLLIVTQLFSGCAAVTALNHPDKKRLDVFSQGTSRENVIAYIGAPVSTERENGETIDIYQFKQGFSGGNKATRAVTHIVLDLLTIFIWELIAWPAEAIIDGDDMTVKVTYDSDKRVKDFVFLKQG